jgi:hypothetical protein
MLHTELPFVSRVGLYLQNFTHKDQYLWNASCPACGDLSKGKQKKRFYIYRPGTANHLNAKCHHCGLSTLFGSFLKTNFPEMYRELVFDNYASTNKKHVPHKNLEEVYLPKRIPIQKEELKDANLDKLKHCKDLKPTHPVAKFLQKRKIPKDKWDLLYYTTKFKEYTNSLIPGKIRSAEEHPRLIVPYFDNHGKMFAYVGRAFDDREPRYFTIKLDDRERIYGLDRLDTKFKKVYAVEGALDSLFIPNCIAVSGSSFDCDTVRMLKSVITLVPDNEPRSREICKLIKKHIDLGYRVCMLPHSIKTKDINEHICSGLSSEQIVELIDKHTYQGAEALLHFSHWKQI